MDETPSTKTPNPKLAGVWLSPYNSVVRKRIAIGWLIFSVIGLVMFFLSQPNEETVDYHRRRYIDAYQGWLLDQELANRARKIVGRPARWQTDTNRMEHHERALIRLGYLDERTVIVSNCSPDKVRNAIYKSASNWRNGTGLLRVEIRETNKVRIVATAKDVPTLEEAARRGDVPDTEK